MIEPVPSECLELALAQDPWCLPTVPGGDDPLLPEGTPIRNLWRGKDYDDLGFSWRFVASLDGGETWEAFETMWDESNGEFPVGLRFDGDRAAQQPR